MRGYRPVPVASPPSEPMLVEASTGLGVLSRIGGDHEEAGGVPHPRAVGVLDGAVEAEHRLRRARRSRRPPRSRARPRRRRRLPRRGGPSARSGEAAGALGHLHQRVAARQHAHRDGAAARPDIDDRCVVTTDVARESARRVRDEGRRADPECGCDVVQSGHARSCTVALHLREERVGEPGGGAELLQCQPTGLSQPADAFTEHGSSGVGGFRLATTHEASPLSTSEASADAWPAMRRLYRSRQLLQFPCSTTSCAVIP